MRDHNMPLYKELRKKSLNYPPKPNLIWSSGRLVKTPASAVAVHRPGSSNIYQAIRQTLKHQKNDNNYVNFSGLRQELDSLLSFEGFGCVNIILVNHAQAKVYVTDSVFGKCHGVTKWTQRTALASTHPSLRSFSFSYF